MAYRTDTESIKGIISVDANLSLTPFIAAANELVTEFCAAAGYSDERMALIETWLAAHFIAVSREPQFTSENLGNSVGYNRGLKLGMFLEQTTYGQQALALDTNGALAQSSKSKGKKVGITWLGTDPTDVNPDDV